MNNNEFERNLAENISIGAQQQYLLYKDKIEELVVQYEELKKESSAISILIQQIRNENIIDNHLSKLFMLIKNDGLRRKKQNNEQALQKIIQYFQKVEKLSIEGLKTIFEIRKFFTGQAFDIYIENEGKVFSFSIDDIEKHIGGIIPTYTDSLEKLINNMASNSKTIAPELTKLGLTLKNTSKDLELKGIQGYLDFVNYHVEKNKLSISENRKLEAAIYLYGRNENADFYNDSVRHSMHIMLGWYIAHGGTKDNITMYKLGDALRKTEEGFKNIEIKMHNGTISLTMIANGIKELNSAFNSENVKEKMIKFFTVNKSKLASPIEKAANEKVRKSIEDIFKYLES